MIGQTLGHYQVVEKIGVGGMGEVYRAHDLNLERDVALKILPTGTLKDESARLRFRREALALSKLNHPNIATVFEFATHGGVDFLAMELIRGTTLSERVKAGPLPDKEILRLGLQLLEGLAAAHAEGVIHRDLKPGNLMITSGGRLKILDFGLAIVVNPSGVQDLTLSVSEATAMSGTLPYMTPEQLRGQPADVRSDIHAAGAVIYEMATGKRPFPQAHSAELIGSILLQTPVPPSTHRSQVPPTLDGIVMKALEKEPGRRYGSASEFLSALEVLTTGVTPWSDPDAATPPNSQSIARSPLSRDTLMRLWAPALVLAVILVGVAAIFVGKWRVWPYAGTFPGQPVMTERELAVYSFPSIPITGVLSPDGKYMAYVLPVQGEERVQLQEVETGETRLLDLPPWFQNYKVAWFSDSSRLLLEGGREGEGRGIWAVSVFGGTPHLLHPGGERPSMSPDGSRIAFRKKGEIWLMGSGGEEPRLLVPASNEGIHLGPPSWLPDGTRVVFKSWRTGSDGEKIALETSSVSSNEASVIWSGRELSWGSELSPPLALPDGRVIVYDNLNLWQIQADRNSGRAANPPKQITHWTLDDHNQHIAFNASRDGKRLAILKGRTRPDVYVGTLEAGGRRLTNVRSLPLGQTFPVPKGWTRDGKNIFFSSWRNGEIDIFRLDIEKGLAEPFLVGPGKKDKIAMSPDGAFVLYTSRQPYDVTRRLMRMPSSGGPAESVLEAKGDITLRCSSRPPGVCVLAEQTAAKTTKPGVVFTICDPLRGRQKEIARMPMAWNWGLEQWDLSPDGTKLVIHMKAVQIQVLDLSGKTLRELPAADIGWVAWAPDQNGIIVGQISKKQDASLAHIDFEGHESVLWQHGYFITYLLPSPDGKRLAWANQSPQVRCVLLENF